MSTKRMSPPETSAVSGGKDIKLAAKFTIDRLRRSCSKLYGVTVSTFDGAAYGLNGKYTIDEMQERIDNWCKKPVIQKNDKAKEEK